MAGPITAPNVSMLLLKPNTRPFVAGVASSLSIASLAAVLTPLPSLSSVRAKNIHNG